MHRQRRFDSPIHETLAIGLCLAFVGGFLDAYTYFLRGGVFANAQTGNLVLLGIEFAEKNFLGAFYYLIPVGAFFAGVLITELLKNRFTATAFLEWQHIVLLAEILLLCAVGFLPAETPDAIINVTVSFICSLQVNSFRATRGLPYASTMCTGNLRSAAEQCYRFLSGDRPAGRNMARYLMIIFAFCIGAAGGAFLSRIWGTFSILLCCAVLGIVFLAMLFGGAVAAPTRGE